MTSARAVTEPGMAMAPEPVPASGWRSRPAPGSAPTWAVASSIPEVLVQFTAGTVNRATMVLGGAGSTIARKAASRVLSWPPAAAAVAVPAAVMATAAASAAIILKLLTITPWTVWGWRGRPYNGNVLVSGSSL